MKSEAEMHSTDKIYPASLSKLYRSRDHAVQYHFALPFLESARFPASVYNCIRLDLLDLVCEIRCMFSTLLAPPPPSLTNLAWVFPFATSRTEINEEIMGFTHGTAGKIYYNVYSHVCSTYGWNLNLYNLFRWYSMASDGYVSNDFSRHSLDLIWYRCMAHPWMPLNC